VAGDGRTAVELFRSLQPAVVVLDISLPGMNGIDAAAQILTEDSSVGILILSMHSDELHVAQAVRAGARGYVLKDSDGSEVITAVKHLARGGTYFSPTLPTVWSPGGDARQDGTAMTAYSRLTAREREVLHLVSEGKANKEIARILSLSINTVETHRKHAMEKLNLHNTAEVVRFALRQQLIS
jgi:DNA-binding NarL/FixJ family response regulator